MMSVAQRASVEDSCVIVLLKLMYLNICRDEVHHRITVSCNCYALDFDEVCYVQFKNCDQVLP